MLSGMAGRVPDPPKPSCLAALNFSTHFPTTGNGRPPAQESGPDLGPVVRIGILVLDLRPNQGVGAKSGTWGPIKVELGPGCAKVSDAWHQPIWRPKTGYLMHIVSNWEYIPPVECPLPTQIEWIPGRVQQTPAMRKCHACIFICFGPVYGGYVSPWLHQRQPQGPSGTSVLSNQDNNYR